MKRKEEKWKGEKENIDLEGLERQSHQLGRTREKTLAKKRLPIQGSW